jgi:hypothetical protein
LDLQWPLVERRRRDTLPRTLRRAQRAAQRGEHGDVDLDRSAQTRLPAVTPLRTPSAARELRGVQRASVRPRPPEIRPSVPGAARPPRRSAFDREAEAAAAERALLVARLKQQVADGTYRPDARAIARGIVERGDL